MRKGLRELKLLMEPILFVLCAGSKNNADLFFYLWVPTLNLPGIWLRDYVELFYLVQMIAENSDALATRVEVFERGVRLTNV